MLGLSLSLYLPKTIIMCMLTNPERERERERERKREREIRWKSLGHLNHRYCLETATAIIGYNSFHGNEGNTTDFLEYQRGSITIQFR